MKQEYSIPPIYRHTIAKTSPLILLMSKLVRTLELISVLLCRWPVSQNCQRSRFDKTKIRKCIILTIWLQVALRNFYKRRRPVYNGREPLVMKNLIGGKVKFQHLWKLLVESQNTQNSHLVLIGGLNITMIILCRAWEVDTFVYSVIEPNFSSSSDTGMYLKYIC